jgi:hypothetical protein
LATEEEAAIPADTSGPREFFRKHMEGFPHLERVLDPEPEKYSELERYTL